MSASIIGFHSRELADYSDKKKLIKMFILSSSYGHRSFGISLRTKSEILNFKSLDLDFLIETIQNHEFNAMIGSASFKRNILKPESSQPLVLGASSLVMTGSFSSTTKEENEKLFDVQLESENEGEILLKLFSKSADTDEFEERSRFGANTPIASLILSESNFIALKGKSKSLYLAGEADHGSVFFSANDFPLIHSGVQGSPTELEAGMIFDLDRM